jgi:hypothetical protein
MGSRIVRLLDPVMARTTIASSTTATAAFGRSPRSIADRASAKASPMKSS